MIRQMKWDRSAIIVSSVVVLLLGASTGDEMNTIAGQPVPWLVLIFLSIAAFLGMAVLTYRMLPEPEESQEGDSNDS